MNAVSIVLAVVIAAAFVWAVVQIVRGKSGGCSGCTGHCEGCPKYRR